MTTKLITNHQYRNIKRFDDLTDKQKKQAVEDYDLVDYMDTTFFVYHDHVYSFHDILKQKTTIEGITFDGAIRESAFSAILVKLCPDGRGEQVLIARVIS